MNENEALMMKVMAELAIAKAPIIFKGAMNLALALQESSPTEVHRETHDIDGDWLLGNTSAETMRKVLEQAVQRVDSSLSVVLFREMAQEKSAGFRIVDADKECVQGGFRAAPPSLLSRLPNFLPRQAALHSRSDASQDVGGQDLRHFQSEGVPTGKRSCGCLHPLAL